MNILVIGACGFVGSHVSTHFKKNHFVYEVDLLNVDKHDYLCTDENLDGVNSLFQMFKFDLCINASGNGSVPISVKEPFLDFEKNVRTVARLLEYIRKHCPDCSFINLSTAAVYGNPRKQPINENSLLAPISPYGFHKYCSELICKEYSLLYQIKTISLRLFSIYGEGLRKQLFYDLYLKSKKSKQIELFGTGEETRDFIYISDLVEAIECVINNAKFEGEALNIASGVETTIRKAATLFCSYLDPDLTLYFNLQQKVGDPLRWKADTSLLSSYNFNNTVDIEIGLKNTASWLKENV